MVYKVLINAVTYKRITLSIRKVVYLKYHLFITYNFFKVNVVLLGYLLCPKAFMFQSTKSPLRHYLDGENGFARQVITIHSVAVAA